MIVNAGDPAAKHLYFSWMFTNWCNYACSYCCAEPDMVDVFDKDDSSASYKFILKRLATVDTTFDVQLLGGEPTLHKHIFECISGLDEIENCTKVVVHTNLSRPARFYKDLFEVSDKLYVSASFHPEYYKQAFTDKCLELNCDRFDCTVNLSDEKEHWDVTEKLIHDLRAGGVDYGCDMLFSTAAKEINYTDEWYDRFTKYLHPDVVSDDARCRIQWVDGTEQFLTPQEIRLQGLDSYTGFKCNAQMYSIGMDGDIINRCSGRRPGIILKGDAFQPEICRLDKCTCGEMFTFYKERV